MTHVLIVDDEVAMRRLLRATLTAHAFTVTEAGTLAEARRALAEDPALVILDLGLPDGDGVELVRALRASSATPVLIISARDREADKIRALDAGADDYLTKPFGTGELLARMRVALRHAASAAGGPAPDAVFTVGPLHLDLGRHAVTVGGAPVHLTPIEFKLLAQLMQHAGTPSAWSMATSAPARLYALKEVFGNRPPSGADLAGERAGHPLAGVLVADRRGVLQVRGADPACRQQGRGRHHGADGACLADEEITGAAAGGDPARPVRRRAVLWRRPDHAGDLGAVAVEGLEVATADLFALCRADHAGHPGRLFWIQSHGTAKVGVAFGPITCCLVRRARRNGR
jgi:two-component system KDP operon response regulator KdpE